MSLVATYSIVAADLARQEWGIAVQSKFFAVGSIVPWAQAGVGAIAIQSYAKPSFGPQALQLLKTGHTAEETLKRLIQYDEEPAWRQLGIVDAQGNAAAYTGEECMPWAGHFIGEHFCCQGNILENADTLQGMVSAYRSTQGELADRLLAALAGAEAAGGDRRGRQSAALLVVKEKGGYGGYNDRFIDLRIDDHASPVEELQRLYGLYRLYYRKSDEAALLPLSPKLVSEIRQYLEKLGYLSSAGGDEMEEVIQDALWEWAGDENLEERLCEDERIDPELLAVLRQRANAV